MDAEELENMMRSERGVSNDDEVDDDAVKARLNSRKIIKDINTMINEGDEGEDQDDSIEIRDSHTAIQGGAFSKGMWEWNCEGFVRICSYHTHQKIFQFLNFF